MLLLLLLAACGDGDSGKTIDTSTFSGDCDRIHDATGVLMFELGDSLSAHYPDSAPSSMKKTSSVAGPYGAAGAYMLVQGSSTLVSADGGCNWSTKGSLDTSGEWDLVPAGATMLAFDRLAARGASTTSDGSTWSAFTLAGTPIGAASVDVADDQRVRVVTSAGVETSEDGGVTWNRANDLPSATLVSASVDAADLDHVVVAGPEGVWYSATGGSAWTPITAFEHLTTASSVVIHPDDGQTWYVGGLGDDGKPELERTLNGGATWTQVVENSDVIDLPSAPAVWAVPGSVDTVATVSATADGVSFYLVTTGVGTQKVSVGDYTAIRDLATSADLVLAAVDAVP